jgi:hypothetical protein
VAKVLDLQLRARPSVALAIPSEATLPRRAVQSVEMLMACNWKPGDHYLALDKIATIHIARNNIVHEFLSLPKSVEFLLMLDSDMVVPSNLIDIWVGNPNARLPFVSGYCTSKIWPYLPIPSMLTGMAELDGKPVHAYVPITNWAVGSGLQECDGVGMAAVCIRRDVLEAMEPPYFAFEGGGGEDFYFCRKLKEIKTVDASRGVPILVDTGTTIGHIGEFEAHPQDFFATKDDWLARTGKAEIDFRPLGRRDSAAIRQEAAAD